jgi:hypothetical protein
MRRGRIAVELGSRAEGVPLRPSVVALAVLELHVDF